MGLSTENRTTLLIHLHKSIEEAANTNANHIINGRLNQLINYPPNGGLTDDEIGALRKLIPPSGSGVVRSFSNNI
jgi:hypothetical protein